MGFFKNGLGRKTRAEPTTSIPTGRVSSASQPYGSSFYRGRSRDLLKELRGIPDEANAIEFMTKKTPDGSMALWNFVRYANQGHKMKFYPVGYKNTEVSLTDIEDEWRDFASRINSISNAGLDGIMDILHKNAVLYGVQMLEVEVNSDRTDIIEVHPIDPRTIHWEWEERNGKKLIIPYQYNDKGQKVDLSKANVFYVPLDPDGNDPKGTLIMSPALRAIDSQLQVFDDVHAVLHHQGYARDFYSINMERALSICPQHIKNDPKELTKWINDYLDNIASNLESVDPDSDIVTYDDVSRNQGQGNATRSVDFRAINEMTDYQTNNGLKQLSTFMNRHTGKTETYSSVEMKIFVQGILSLQRGSKRLMEEIARLWLRVKGIQAIPVFTHNVVDWQSELDKEEVATSKMSRYIYTVAMGWVDNDTAAREAMGVKKAVSDRPLVEMKISLSSGGVSVENNDKHSGEEPKLE
ncbi:hypothetical protein [Tissierella sp.]|uniref:hypothetical protein n=1 Tax=Tissierella sp. TaxID=41274 RepID=UPI0028650444|nr:hypothetical protein [Tissierella sp.]MDR7856092.1 hypothetical protein [Tissierella sp.]